MASAEGLRVERFEYQASLDGVRAFAVVAVFVFHTAKSAVPAGGLGVDVFFVLSGFLITTLLLQERLRTDGINLRLFYARRALRLFPALAAMLAVMGLWSLALSDLNAEVLRREIVASALYVYNFGEQLGILSPEVDGNGFIYHTWSLAVEEQFYIVWPFVFGALLKYLRPVSGFVALLVVLAIIPIVRSWPSLPATDIAVSLSPHGEIVVGCLAALAYNLWIVALRERLSAVFAWSSLVCFIGIMCQLKFELLHGGVAHIAVTLMAAVLTIGLVGNPRSLIARFLSWRPFVAIGVVSYGIYLWHLPVRAWCKEYVLPHWDFGEPVYLALLTAVTAVVVVASYWVIELPALRLKSRLRVTASGAEGRDARPDD